MNTEVVRAIEDLIDKWAKTLPDTEFLEALEEMADRAMTAYNARQEELEADA